MIIIEEKNIGIMQIMWYKSSKRDSGSPLVTTDASWVLLFNTKDMCLVMYRKIVGSSATWGAYGSLVCHQRTAELDPAQRSIVTQSQRSEVIDNTLIDALQLWKLI